MEEKGQQGKDRVSPASISALPLHGDGLVADNQMDKPLSPKDERNPPPNTAAISNQSEGLNANPVNPSNIFAPPEQTYFYGGYDDGSTNWGDYSNYINPNNLQIVPPAIYSDNTSLLFHPAYGFDYSQFSPIAGPMSPIMIDGQLFSPHQVPMSPSYYSQPVSPNLSHVTSPPTSANTGQEGIGDNNVFLAPGSGYYLHYGSFGGNNSNGNNNGVGFYNGEVVMSSDNSYVSPLTSGGLYPAPGGILGSYEHIFSQQQNAYGYVSVSGSGSSTRRGSFRGYNSNNSIYQGDRFMPEKGGKNRDRDGTINEPQSDRNNRGPRALKAKGDQIPSSDSALYNQPDFVTDYENAKFFVIKSFSEDNVHKSIKYGVWASTPLGNRKLDAAFQQAKEGPTDCPVFLFFSVNASGQFCGVAEMVGPVDFGNDAEYWQQDRWSGQFRVKWHIIKDVPNSRFRHILLENNDNKPVTHSRDSQEVKLEAGITMLKIFKDHDTDTSILDDFSYYDDREKDLQEKRTKEREITKNTPTDNTSITQLTDKVESLHVDEKREEEVQ